MILTTEKVNSLNGTLTLRGDKSVSHRSVMFSAMADGVSTIKNCLMSEDLHSTINCFRALGCTIDVSDELIKVRGKGYKGFTAPDEFLDCGNSGTTTRLIAGILAPQSFNTTLIGDDSLSVRPMRRIVDPLNSMGADITVTDKGTLPMQIHGVESLNAIEYSMPVASAQVKSAVLLAGLFNEEPTCVIEKAKTRNHTETMLGLEVVEEAEIRKIYSSKKNYPEPADYLVPSDISSAAFFTVLALLTKNSEVIIKDVLLNPSRTGILNVLISMGADIKVADKKVSSGEEYGDLIIRSGELKNVHIPSEIIPNIIDEIPVLSVAGLFAEGEFTLRGAEELRFKESDRIKALCDNYRLLGVDVEEYQDGFTISGGIKNSSELLQSYGDHRIAMTFAVLGSLSQQALRINDFECAAVSNPDFLDQLKSISK